MSAVVRGCRWALRYASRWHCRCEAACDPVAPFVPLDLGCPDDCTDLEFVAGKEEAYPEDPPAASPEWEDEG